LRGLVPGKCGRGKKRRKVQTLLTFFFSSRGALDPLKGDLSDPDTFRLRMLFTVRKEEPAMAEEALVTGEDGKGDSIVDMGDRKELFSTDFVGVFNFEARFPRAGVG
jgi:hypothetical protein